MQSRLWKFLIFAGISGLVLMLAFNQPGRFADGRSIRQAPGERAITIALVPMGTTDEYWRAVYVGAVSASRELGVALVFQGPMRRDDRSAQLDVVDAMVVRQVDAIVLAPIDNMALRGPVEDAYRSSIPVIVIDSDLQSDRTASFIRTDNYKAGFMAGEHLAGLLNHHGRVALLRGVEGNASTDHRERGFLDALAAYPEITLVSSSQHGGGTSETAYKASENILAPLKGSDGKIALDGVFCPNESTTFGMLRALEDSGLGGSVRFVGFDFSPKLLDALEKGTIDALVAQDPVRMGYLGIKAAAQKVRQPELALEPVVDVPATIVTRQNMTEPQVKSLVRPNLRILDGVGD